MASLLLGNSGPSLTCGLVCPLPGDLARLQMICPLLGSWHRPLPTEPLCDYPCELLCPADSALPCSDLFVTVYSVLSTVNCPVPCLEIFFSDHFSQLRFVFATFLAIFVVLCLFCRMVPSYTVFNLSFNLVFVPCPFFICLQFYQFSMLPPLSFCKLRSHQPNSYTSSSILLHLHSSGSSPHLTSFILLTLQRRFYPPLVAL
jgi:hypothetical protein